MLLHVCWKCYLIWMSEKQCSWIKPCWCLKMNLWYIKNVKSWKESHTIPFWVPGFISYNVPKSKCPLSRANKGAMAMQSKLIRFYLRPHFFASAAILFHSFCLPLCVCLIDIQERPKGGMERLMVWWRKKKSKETAHTYVCVYVWMCVNWFSIAADSAQRALDCSAETDLRLH